VAVSEVIKVVVSIFLYCQDNGSQRSEKDIEFEHELEEGGPIVHHGENEMTANMGGFVHSFRQNIMSEAVYGLAYVAVAYMIASGVVSIAQESCVDIE
jgi:hypothetical protein